MDTQNSSVVDVPDMKLAKVGSKRDKKRGGAGWFGARGAGSAFSGAAGGAGAGGGIFGAGMSLAKLLTVLLVSGGLSAGAWQVGNMMASNNSAGGGPAPKVFADKEGPQKYADTSGVIKGGDKSIPNSLGYINNDGLTDEQRVAKKAAEDAAAAKAAADSQAKADADAKEKALADAKAASATPDPTAAAASPESPKLGLNGGRFGGMKSSFGGGGQLSGGAGLSGGINRSFGGAGDLGGKPQSGALAAFRSPTKVASTRAAGPTPGKSNSKGFAKQQLDMANGMSRMAAATGKSETASSGAATPFDNNAAQGSVISGPGLGNGAQTGPADSGAGNNPSSGGGGGGLTSGGACANANFEPNINGDCVSQTPNPHGQDAAPYQGMIDTCLILLLLIMLLSFIAMTIKNFPPYGRGIAYGLCCVVAAMGLAITAMGIKIAAMKHGDFMIGTILTVVGVYISATALVSLGSGTSTPADLVAPANVLIASSLGALTAASTKMNQAAMQ